MELFIYGNPRLLAGGEGSGAHRREGYEYDPVVLEGTGHTTDDCESVVSASAPSGRIDAFQKMGTLGECVHKGKSGYHSNINYNKFLVPGQWPSAGVELEMISSAYNHDHTDGLVNDLRSNWFHFERDGSLDDAHSGEYGYELITEPLPPRVYRNPQTWVGLENILSPWLESFDHPCTGLHVHVGLNQFMDYDIPLKNRVSRLYVGKVMSMLVYFTIAGAAFIDRVCLRKQTRYCRTPGERLLFEGTSGLSAGGMTGYEFMDLAIGKLILQDPSNWANCCHSASNLRVGDNPVPFCQRSIAGTTSHGTEVNTEHRFTIEFRRAKGTLHALSVHRVVELMTMIVRYAGKCCRNPNEIVSSKAFYEFVHDNTTSAPLKKLVEEATPFS